MGISIGSAVASGAHDPALAVASLVTWAFTASIGAFMLTRWILRGGLRRPRTSDRDLPRPVIFGHFGLAVSGLVLWAAFVLSGWDTLAWSAVCVLMPAIGLGICTVTLWTPYPTYPVGTPGSVDPARVAAGGRVAGPAGGHVAGPAGDHVAGPAGGMLAAPAEDVLARRLTDDVLARALHDDALARRLAEEVLASVFPAPPQRGRRKPRGHLAPLIPAAHGVGAVVTFLLAVLGAIGGR